MKFAPMNYHYLRYPIKKFLDKVERSPFNSIDLYCSAPQLNLFDYPLLRLIELKKEIEAHHLSVMAMTPENCVYPVNFCTQDDLTRESSIRYYQRAIDTAQFLDCPCVQISTGYHVSEMKVDGYTTEITYKGDRQYSITVTNTKNWFDSLLPETGGMGKALLYTLGVLLLCLVTATEYRKRKSTRSQSSYK